MPEGHTIHRLAADLSERFAGRPARASSPQGKFSDGAALVDGRVLARTDAVGKHLFLGFQAFQAFQGFQRCQGPTGPTPAASGRAEAESADPDADLDADLDWVHIHLGLFGKLGFGPAPAPPPTETVRLRLLNSTAYADLRGPTACALLNEAEKQAVSARLGPDPLRADADPDRAWARVSRSRTSIAALLMDQKVIAGVGNVYRAEVLFRHGVDPYRAGRDLDRGLWQAMWTDLAALMREGVRHNRIDTVRPEHTPEAMNRPPRADDHGGEVYVYRRNAMPCHVCGTEVRTAELGGRNLFWCPGCQKPCGSHGATSAPNAREAPSRAPGRSSRTRPAAASERSEVPPR
ncbi:zinc finger domain-containing protein [Streptomyces sp. 549]|uniref:Fpg/Nei family DNA glycosylase n=1 Tax=Streptomyces sp. 549 TaxID=3049076 RepID=UPI0024C3A6D9|nr:DNA-formamidopyrimidine glycosylase family protein [Streptomyces sp. 549]MDK1474408.1 zinc finger domain-containing protein [Streptomyces sp. 549]